MFFRKSVFLSVLILFFSSSTVGAKRCATSLRDTELSFNHTPQAYRVPYRVPVPLPDNQPHIYPKDHFRVLWNDAYDHSDPDWDDSDGDTIPDWVETIGDTLENAYGLLVNMGFSPPYGVDKYYIDAYIGNTGVVVEGKNITLSSDFYGYTDIDKQFNVAYFIFNDDFSGHTDNELDVLRVTAVHELFHAIQRVDYPWDDETAIPDPRWNSEKWWFEATSTWMEEIIEPQVNDHIQYIQKFLQYPDRSLTRADGEREYGAAIFPGYLWYRHGGAAAWQEIMVNTNTLGVEAAIDNYLAAGGNSFIDTVAAFWSMAGHPEDLWPDGEQFYPADHAALFSRINSLPVDIETTTTTAPEYLGARLYRLATTASRVNATLSTPASSNAYKLAVSDTRQNNVSVLRLQSQTATPFSASPVLETSVAMVNISAPDQTLQFQMRWEDISPVLAGDMNTDNVIELQDLIVALQIAAGYNADDYNIDMTFTPAQDVDADGIPTTVEAVYILQVLSGR